LFEGGNGREGLEDVVTGYTDVVIDVEVIPCCKGLFETSFIMILARLSLRLESENIYLGAVASLKNVYRLYPSRNIFNYS